MRQAYASARTHAERLVYAHVLGIMGDAAGAETLAAVVSGRQPGLGLSVGGESAAERVLREYAKDLRGVYALHATHVLKRD